VSISPLTSSDSYFEDFKPGEVIRHGRGKTIEPLENVLITNMVMNSASAHFDEHSMKGSRFGKRLQFGGVTASLIVGMASQDTGENAIAELGLDKIRFKSPVFHGDTLYAFTEVLDKRDADDNPGAGIVRFKHWGVNQNDVIVFEGERTTLIKRRNAAA
jgi:itaconyl-CoA hydratase